MMEDFPIQKIFLLGDLFHSRHNSEWEQFIRWRNTFPEIEFHLIKGNHDILDEALIHQGKIILHENTFVEAPFLFSHQYVENEDDNLYQFFGHIHPGVRLNGKGLQSLSLPCFCFGKRSGVLPAFGNFTGKAIIQPAAFDEVYVIYSETVKQLFNEKHQ
jgi:DNA ligase-associated metallophosphoesterase